MPSVSHATLHVFTSCLSFPGYVYDWTMFKKIAIDELQVGLLSRVFLLLGQTCAKVLILLLKHKMLLQTKREIQMRFTEQGEQTIKKVAIVCFKLNPFASWSQSSTATDDSATTKWDVYCVLTNQTRD